MMRLKLMNILLNIIHKHDVSKRFDIGDFN